MQDATRCVYLDQGSGDSFGATSPPIYQTATFGQESALEAGRYDYSRSGNPTRETLERQLARLEGSERAFAFSTGMAALTALVRAVASGGTVVTGDDLYGGTHRLLTRLAPSCGIELRQVDTCDPAAVEAALDARTRLILVETPTNPRLRIANLVALGTIAENHGVPLAVDNSLLSPLLQRPLELGARYVVHSGTKIMGGHGDLCAGVVAVRDEKDAGGIYDIQNGEGAVLGPFDSWLLLRGLKTLAIRLDRQQDNARRIAALLDRRPEIRRLYYPGLPDHPGAEIHARQSKGPGYVLAFETGDLDFSLRLVDALELFTISVSFGSVSSLASLPCRMSHASIPPEQRKKLSLSEDLVRLSIGIEDIEDLLADLERALDRAKTKIPDRVAAP